MENLQDERGMMEEEDVHGTKANHLSVNCSQTYFFHSPSRFPNPPMASSQSVLCHVLPSLAPLISNTLFLQPQREQRWCLDDNMSRLDNICGGYRCCQAVKPQVIGFSLESSGGNTTQGGGDCKVAFFDDANVTEAEEIYSVVELGWFFDSRLRDPVTVTPIILVTEGILIFLVDVLH